MTKRMLSMILTLSLIITCFVSAASAEADSDVTAALSASKALRDLSEQCADKLLAFEIFDENTETDIVTRSGFVTYLLKLINRKAFGAKDETSVFDDVETNIAELNTAQALGIISGSDGHFYPEQAITGTDAAVMLIRCLGYQAAADEGGYPFGYTKLAGELRLFQDARVMDWNEALTYKQIAIIFQNALNTKLMYRDGNGKYVKSQDVTALNYYHKIFRARDIVKANNRTNLTGTARLADNNVMIGDTVYDAGQSGADDYLGYKVDYYYFDDGKGALPVVKYAQQDNSTELLVIDAEDVEGLDDANRLKYYDNERQKNITIPSELQVVFNNVPSIKVNREDFKPESGYLKFVDNNGDGQYDVLFIQSYRTVVVNSVFANEERIQDYISGEVVKFQDYDRYEMTAKGIKVDVEELKKWTVLSIAESKDKEYAEILVGNDKASGRIEEISEDMIKIGDTEYPMSGYLKNLIRDGRIKLSAGNAAIFYLNFRGEAVICDTSMLAGRYGVIAGIKETSFGDACDVLLLDRDEGKRQLTTAKNVSIDGEKYHSGNIGAKLKEIMSSTYYGVVPVVYETNAEQQLTKLETPNGQELTPLCSDENCYYVGSASTFLRDRQNGLFCAGSSTFFCYAPENSSNIDDYTVRTLQTISGDIDAMIYAFAIGDSRIADFVLIKSDPSLDLKVSKGESLGVVTGKGRGLDEEGEPIELLYVYKNRNELKVPLKNKEDADKVEKGDIIFYRQVQNRPVEGFELVFKARKAGMFDVCAAERGLVAGKVYYKEGPVIGLTANEAQPDQLIYCNLVSLPIIYVYDTKTDKITLGSIDDIADYPSAGESASTVFVQTNYTRVTNVVIYN